jgi:glycosyltransferase involved in cell wall biosynthesis
MIEAMACGTPVLGMRLGSVSEVIDEGITGFSGESVEQLCALLPKVLALDRRRVQSHARERFHFKKMVEGYERLYRELIRRKA